MILYVYYIGQYFELRTCLFYENNYIQKSNSFVRLKRVPIVGVCNYSMFCCTYSSFAIILMVKTELVALLSLSSW